MTSSLDVGVAVRAHKSLDSLHSLIYFVPEAEEEYAAIGLKPGRMGYFASRSAAMGPVAGGVTAATFYNFSPSLVARSIPAAWDRASCTDILAARLRAVDRSWRRLLGDDVVDGAEVAEAADLAARATANLPVDGRPLFAAHADLEAPSEPHLALWHAITLLREYRGDGHIAALVCHRLRGLEALITHTHTGAGFTVAAAKTTRGWSDEAWAGGEAWLRERGLLDADGLTSDGQALRATVEQDTDLAAEAPWLQLGPDGTDRLREIGKKLTHAVVAAGAFPPGVFAAAKG